MTASNTGGWVRKVGASGGGRTYRRRRPINFYGAIAVICVLGVASIALARYTYQHPAAAAGKPQPAVGDVWYAALGIATCGEQQPALAQNPTAVVNGFTALPGGAIQVKPVLSSQTGSNATLAKFVAAYRGLEVSKTTLVIPPSGKEKKATTWTTGMKCPTGTKDAGKVGHVEIATWKTLSSTTAKTTTDTADVHFTQNMLITIGFVPEGVLPPKPPNSAIKAMLNAHVSTSTTTTVPATSTTAHVTTTTKH